jgi:hypothetical protein
MRCNQLFKTSDNLLKQKILRVLVYNVELYNKTLSYTLNDPYKGFIELNKKCLDEPDSQLWCTSYDVSKLADTLVARATDSQDDYLLQELVEDLQLSGELFAV